MTKARRPRHGGAFVVTPALRGSVPGEALRLRARPRRWNAAQFCKVDRDFLGDEACTKMYGTNGNEANAHGKCVSAN